MSICIKKFIGFLSAFKGQGFIFYTGCLYIILTYLRPQEIYPQLKFLPWLQLTILSGLAAMALRKRLEVTKEHAVLFIFATVGLISAYNSLYPDISETHVSTPFIWAMEVLFLSNVPRNRKQLNMILFLWFLVLAKMSIFGARSMISRGFSFTSWGISGPPGFFQNSGEYGLLMAMLAIMSIPFVLNLSECRKIMWVLPVSATISVLGSSSRGDQLALVIGFLYLFFSLGKIRLKTIFIICSVFSVLYLLIPEDQLSRFQTAGEDDTSTSRLEYWAAGIEMIKEYPVLGVGLAAFPDYYNDRFKDKTNLSEFLANRKEVSHNSFIQIGSTMGFSGLLLYLYILWAVYAKTNPLGPEKADNYKSNGLMVEQSVRYGLVVYIIGSMFMSVAFYPYIYFLLAIKIAHKRITRSDVTCV